MLRLGRRLVRMAVAIARAETPAGLLAEHLGSEAPSLPVVGEGWAAYDHVNVQGALDRWTQTPGRSTILVGLTNFQHAMFTLADIAQPGVSMYGVGIGAAAMARMASGPGGATRRVCALWSLFDQRGSGSHGPLVS